MSGHLRATSALVLVLVGSSGCASKSAPSAQLADCVAVGQALAQLRLGNYATPEERAPIATEIASLCTTARLSRADGECLITASDRDGAAACPRPLLPELAGLPSADCGAVGQALRRLAADSLPEGSDPRLTQLFRQVMQVLDRSCTNDRWSAEVRSCIVQAPTSNAIEGCIERLPRELRDRLEQDISKVAQRLEGGDGGDEPGAAVAGCDRLEAAISRVEACTRAPAALRDVVLGPIAPLAPLRRVPRQLLPATSRVAADALCDKLAPTLEANATRIGC